MRAGLTPHLPDAFSPHLELLSRRPTGLELYRLDLDALRLQGLPPLILLLRPNGRAQLGSWSLRHQRALERLLPGEGSAVLSRMLVPIEQLCERRGCENLLVRQECALPEGLALASGPVLPMLPPPYARHCTYLQLSTSREALQERLLGLSMPGDRTDCWTAEPLPAFAPVGGSLLRRVPVFLPWLVALFREIFENGADLEIASDLSHQLALLELSLAAAWLLPELWVLRLDGQPVGLFLSRLCDDRVAELSFVGLIPALHGVSEAGRALMRACVVAMSRLDAVEAQCAVADCNGRSQGFFQRHWGFVPVGTESSWQRFF